MSKLNHQITGARESIILTNENISYEFLMSPLSDKDISELDLWIQNRYINESLAAITEPTQADSERINKIASQLSATSSVGAKMMDCTDGFARVLWQSIHKNHPGITYAELVPLGESVFNRVQINQKLSSLNNAESRILPKKEKDKGNNGRPPPDKAFVYCMLAERNGWTFADIAEMTPIQQIIALSKGEAANSGEISFSTEEEYLAWKASRESR